MGSGASRQALLQRSDSRIDALLAEARKTSDDERLLGLVMKKIPPDTRIDLRDLKRPNTERMSSYIEEGWCHDATTSLHETKLPDTDDTRGESEEKSGHEGETEEEGYSTDDFEDDEVTEWKKGASIGAGSYGTVFLARDEDTGSLMAVKEILISEEADSVIREATREVDLLRSLKHENIVKYLGCHVDNEARTLSIFTEWVPGGSLEHNRKLFGGNERVVRRFTHQLLSGVAYLHSKNIIHHDIKPANILVDQNGVVKIADFGSSRLMNSATMASSSSRSLHGTPNYMAPEVIKQTSGRSRTADIWSIGCTVLRLLTGGPLWGDRHFDSQAALLYYIANLQELPALPEGLSPEAQAFILACLQIDPALRPSAAELLKFPFARYAGQKSDPVAPEPVTVTTARRHTAPAVTSPPSGRSGHHPRRSEKQYRHDEEASKKADIRVKTTTPTLTRKPSLVSTLFSPLETNSSLLEDAPDNAVGEVTPDDSAAEVTLASQYSHEDPAARSENNGDLVLASWEEKPILSALAQKDREQLQAQAVEAARRRQERERKFQEELEAYRHESFAGRA